MRAMSRARSLAVVLGLSAGGCGSARAPVPPPTTGSAAPADAALAPDAPLALDRDLPRLAERAVRLYEDVVARFRVVGEDCAAATTALRELQGTYADVVAANAKVLHEGRGRDLKAALAPHDARFDAAAKQLVASPTLARCATDAAFAQAFDDLVGAPP